MEDASAYPYLFAELMGHGWSVEELTKLAGGNLLRVMSEVKNFKLFLKPFLSNIQSMNEFQPQNYLSLSPTFFDV